MQCLTLYEHNIRVERLRNFFRDIFQYLYSAFIVFFFQQIIDRRGPKIPIVVVGNKCELPERFLPTEITEAIARYDWECGYVECSAKDNKNIVQVFKELLSQAKVNKKSTFTLVCWYELLATKLQS